MDYTPCKIYLKQATLLLSFQITKQTQNIACRMNQKVLNILYILFGKHKQSSSKNSSFKSTILLSSILHAKIFFSKLLAAAVNMCHYDNLFNRLATHLEKLVNPVLTVLLLHPSSHPRKNKKYPALYSRLGLHSFTNL